MNTYVDRLRSERESLHTAVTGIAERAAAEGRDISPAEEATVKQAGVRTEEIDRQLSEFTGQLAAANRYAAMVESTDAELAEHDSRRVTSTPTVERAADGERHLSIGEEVVERGTLDTFDGRNHVRVDLDGRSLLERALVTTDSIGAPPANPGVPFVLPDGPTGAASVMGRGQVSSDSIYYVQATVNPDMAGVVPEGTAKPEAAFTFTPLTAPVVTIAWWVPVTRQALQDTAWLSSLLDGQLRRGVLRRLNYEIINGDGTGGDITGLVSATGTVPVSGANEPATYLEAIIALEANGYAPNAILGNPTDLAALGGQVDTTTATGEVRRTTGIYGLPFVPDVNVPTGTAWVGDFANAATVHDRMQTAVFTGEQHADNFTKNIIVVLAEGRWGFTIEEPGGIAEVTLTP